MSLTQTMPCVAKTKTISTEIVAPKARTMYRSGAVITTKLNALCCLTRRESISKHEATRQDLLSRKRTLNAGLISGDKGISTRNHLHQLHGPEAGRGDRVRRLGTSTTSRLLARLTLVVQLPDSPSSGHNLGANPSKSWRDTS